MNHTDFHASLSSHDGCTTNSDLKDRQMKLIEHCRLNIPAYKNLSEPITSLDKESFIDKFSLPKRCLEGDISNLDFIHASSGSSGVPTFWGRTRRDESQISLRFQQIFETFKSRDVPTLVVIVLPMGSWVGGVFSTFCIRELTAFNYKLTLMTPGNVMADILKILSGLIPSLFEQVCIVGYPPFCKGVIDNALGSGIDLKALRLKFILAGEVFSEEWRTLMMTRCKILQASDIVSIYGTADAGVLGCETPLTIHLRRLISSASREVCSDVFGKDRLPTLVQYDPRNRLFEQKKDGILIFSTMPAVGEKGDFSFPVSPLVRYNIGDAGGIYSFDTFLSKLSGHGIDLPSDLDHYRLPFAFVFGRSFWTKSLYGANVYVENVMVGVENPAVAFLVTGKFVLYVTSMEAGNDVRLKIVIELAPSIKDDLGVIEKLVQDSVLDALVRLNGEYAAYVPFAMQPPLIVLKPYGTPEFFPVGVKHKYIQD